MIPFLENWPDQLDIFNECQRTTPFEWGKNDCCLFAANWVALATGHDPAATYRGSYRSALGAARHLRKAGGIIAVADAQLTPFAVTRCQPAFAGRGSVVVAEVDKRLALGVSYGDKGLFISPEGTVWLPTSQFITGWRPL